MRPLYLSHPLIYYSCLRQAYLEKDAKEMKAKMEAESKALQEKLDKEASALKSKMSEDEEARRKETKALQEKLEREKEALAKQVIKLVFAKSLPRPGRGRVNLGSLWFFIYFLSL